MDNSFESLISEARKYIIGIESNRPNPTIKQFDIKSDRKEPTITQYNIESDRGDPQIQEYSPVSDRPEPIIQPLDIQSDNPNREPLPLESNYSAPETEIPDKAHIYIERDSTQEQSVERSIEGTDKQHLIDLSKESQFLEKNTKTSPLPVKETLPKDYSLTEQINDEGLWKVEAATYTSQVDSVQEKPLNNKVAGDGVLGKRKNANDINNSTEGWYSGQAGLDRITMQSRLDNLKQKLTYENESENNEYTAPNVNDFHIALDEEQPTPAPDTSTSGWYDPLLTDADLAKQTLKERTLVLRDVLEGNIEVPRISDDYTPQTFPLEDPDKVENSLYSRSATVVKNSPISKMISVGPDAMQNAFDVFFYYPSPANIKNNRAPFKDITPNNPLKGLIKKMAYSRTGAEDAEITKYLENFTGATVLGVRAQSIKIPQPTIEPSSIKFLYKTISKVGTPKQDLTSSLSLRTDQNLFIHDMFSTLAGQCLLVRGCMDGNGLQESQIRELSQMPRIWQRATGFSEKYRLSDPGLCLIVKMRNLGQPNMDNIYRYIREGGSDIDKDVIPDKFMPYFVFENIKILGSGAGISLSVGNTSMGNPMAIDFIFRRVVKVVMSEEDSKLAQIPSLMEIDRQDNPQYWA